MVDKRAFLVLGPESSGTRLMTRLLIAAGCVGDDGHDQRWDESLPEYEPLVVIRRSVPHRGEWEPPNMHIDNLRERGYDVTIVVMSRDWHSMAISQEQAPHSESTDEALANIRRAYIHIFGAVKWTPDDYELVNYEALTQRPPGTVRYLFRRLGLPEPESLPHIYDGNARYYGESLEAVTVNGDVGKVITEIRDTWGFEPPAEYAAALVRFVDEVARG